MLRSAASKVMWVGRATVLPVVLAVMLVLVFGVSSPASAHKGYKGIFHLGHKNVASTVSTLVKKGTGPALSLKVGSGQPPLAVNSPTKVAKLNADRVDDREASSFANGVGGKATDADKLDGVDSTGFLKSAQKASDADKLDGIDSTGFLRSGGKAADSDKLDGKDSSAFAAASHDHDSRYYTETESDGRYLGKTQKAADADKLDGKEPGELPGVVVSTEGFAGPVSSIPGNTESWVFAGPTAQVTTTSTQRLVGAAQAPLALSTTGSKPILYGLCYQPSSGGALFNFANGSWRVDDKISLGEATDTRVSWSAAATVVPGAGTWNVGFCVMNGQSGAAFDDNGSANGWVQVVNP